MMKKIHGFKAEVPSVSVLAQCYDRLGQHDKALAHHKEAEEEVMARFHLPADVDHDKLPPSTVVAEMKEKLADSLRMNGQYDEAIRKYDAAFQIYRKLKPVPDFQMGIIAQKQALCSISKENIHRAGELLEESIIYFDRAIHREELNDHPAVSETYRLLSYTSKRRRQFKNACEFARSAFESEKSLLMPYEGLKEKLASSAHSLAKLEYFAGEWNSSLEHFSFSEELYRDVNSVAFERLDALYHLSILHLERGATHEAYSKANELFSFLKRGDDDSSPSSDLNDAVIRMLCHISKVCVAQNDLETAKRAQESAERIQETQVKIGDLSQVAIRIGAARLYPERQDTDDLGDFFRYGAHIPENLDTVELMIEVAELEIQRGVEKGKVNELLKRAVSRFFTLGLISNHPIYAKVKVLQFNFDSQRDLEEAFNNIENSFRIWKSCFERLPELIQKDLCRIIQLALSLEKPETLIIYSKEYLEYLRRHPHLSLAEAPKLLLEVLTYLKSEKRTINVNSLAKSMLGLAILDIELRREVLEILCDSLLLFEPTDTEEYLGYSNMLLELYIQSDMKMKRISLAVDRCRILSKKAEGFHHIKPDLYFLISQVNENIEIAVVILDVLEEASENSLTSDLPEKNQSSSLYFRLFIHSLVTFQHRYPIDSKHFKRNSE